MHKLTFLAALAVAAAVTGCKSIEVERYAAKLATIKGADGTEQIVKDKDGNPIILDGGWAVDYFQHWNWQKFDALRAQAGANVSLEINNYEGGADPSNLTALVAASFDGGAKLATAIGDAYVKIAGGGAQADAALGVIKKIYNAFKGAGGDISSATTTIDGDKITISDGSVCIECDKAGNCTTGTCPPSSSGGSCSSGSCELTPSDLK